eukprot:930388-Rhodomonas_salina.1
MAGAASELSSLTAVWLLPPPTLLSYTSFGEFLAKLPVKADKETQSAGMLESDHTTLVWPRETTVTTGHDDRASVPRPIRSETEYFSDMIPGSVGEQ